MVPDSNSSGPPNLLVANKIQSPWSFPQETIDIPNTSSGEHNSPPGMAPMVTRRSSRRIQSPQQASGSDNNGSTFSASVKEDENHHRRSSRNKNSRSYYESPAEEEATEDNEDPIDLLGQDDGRNGHNANFNEDDGGNSPRYNTRHSAKPKPAIVESDDEEHQPIGRRLRKRHESLPKTKSNGRRTRHSSQSARSKPRTTRSRADEDSSDAYVGTNGNSSTTSADGDGSVEVSSEESPEPDPEEEKEEDGEGQGADGPGYTLRRRRPVNYAIPPPLEELNQPPPKPKGKGRAGKLPTRRKGPGWSASGAELSRWMGGDDSVRNTLIVEPDPY